jgi:hypothetical protein
VRADWLCETFTNSETSDGQATNVPSYLGEKSVRTMKVTATSKALLPVLVLLAVSAFAADKNKGTLLINEPVAVSGHQLAAGEYNLAWEGTGSEVSLTVLSNKKVVATLPAHMVDLNYASDGNKSELHKNADGTLSLTQVDFKGKKYALTFTEAASGPEAGAQ